MKRMNFDYTIDYRRYMESVIEELTETKSRLDHLVVSRDLNDKDRKIKSFFEVKRTINRLNEIGETLSCFDPEMIPKQGIDVDYAKSLADGYMILKEHLIKRSNFLTKRNGLPNLNDYSKAKNFDSYLNYLSQEDNTGII